MSPNYRTGGRRHPRWTHDHTRVHNHYYDQHARSPAALRSTWGTRVRRGGASTPGRRSNALSVLSRAHSNVRLHLGVTTILQCTAVVLERTTGYCHLNTKERSDSRRFCTGALRSVLLSYSIWNKVKRQQCHLPADGDASGHLPQIMLRRRVVQQYFCFGYCCTNKRTGDQSSKPYGEGHAGRWRKRQLA